jgi:hypothetical protein
MRRSDKPHICLRRLIGGGDSRSPGYIVYGRFYPFTDAIFVRQALAAEHRSNGDITLYSAIPFIAEHGADYDRAN